MPSLVTLAEIRLRFNLADEDTVNTLLDQSLLATSFFVESWLQTDFDAVSNVVEQFHLPTSRPSTIDPHYPSLRLNNGFVSVLNTIKASGVRSELSGAAAITQANYIDTDTERGVVTIDMLFPDNTFTVRRGMLEPSTNAWFFEVDYDKGFTTLPQSGGSAVYQSVPGWLKEMAMIIGKSIYDVGGSCEGEEVLKGPKGAMVSMLLGKKQRNLPYTVKPVFARV